MLKRRLGKKVLAAALALALTVSVAEVLPGGGVSVKAASIPEAAYKWTFEDATGTEAANSGSVSGGAASLKGTAKIQEEQLKIADKTYSTMFLRCPAGRRGLLTPNCQRSCMMVSVHRQE